MELVKLVNLNENKIKVKLRCVSVGDFEDFTTGKIYTPTKSFNEFGYLYVEVIDDVGDTISMCLKFDKLKNPNSYTWFSKFKILCMPEVG